MAILFFLDINLLEIEMFSPCLTVFQIQSKLDRTYQEISLLQLVCSKMACFLSCKPRIVAVNAIIFTSDEEVLRYLMFCKFFLKEVSLYRPLKNTILCVNDRQMKR